MAKLNRNLPVLLAFLLLAGTASASRATAGDRAMRATVAASLEAHGQQPKAATACSRQESPWGSSPYEPSFWGCMRGSGGCYVCDYSRNGSVWTCFESPDGSEQFCPDIPDSP